MSEAEDYERHAKPMLQMLYLARDGKALKELAENAPSQYIRDCAAGLLLRPWLPWGRAQRVLMVLIGVAGVTLAVALDSAFPLLVLLLDLIFSPRIVGETMAFMGSLRR